MSLDLTGLPKLKNLEIILNPSDDFNSLMSDNDINEESKLFILTDK
jgi:hypothetical protein